MFSIGETRVLGAIKRLFNKHKLLPAFQLQLTVAKIHHQ
jgi:hypothetical protein